MLEVDQLTKHFAGLVAVDAVSFSVEEGSIVGLIGPNGAGKTSLVNCMTGIYLPDEGEMRWRGRRLSGLSPDRIVAAGVARSFQHAHLFPDQTVLENVMVGAHRLGHSGLLSAIFRLPALREDEQTMRESAEEALVALRCSDLAGRVASELTAGQQRLVAVARAVASQPDVLLLDEPAAGLNDAETAVLAEDLRRLVDARGTTVLVIEHHLAFVMSLSDRVIALAEGSIIADGSPEHIRRDAAVIESYIGAD
jgi:branched-chain amino acid transport system ATP-binding protein